MPDYQKIIKDVLNKITTSKDNNIYFSKKDFEKNRPIMWKIIGKLFPKLRNYPFHNLTKFKNLEKNEKEFIKIMKKINGMSTLTNALIINTLCRTMKNKNYVNIGCWEGFSLISGMINTNCNVYGVDNFSQFDGPAKKFYKNFNLYKKKNHYFFELDYKNFFFKIWKKKNKKIDLYFYDGNHSYKDQLHSLEIAKPYFQKGSLIIVDDTNIKDVKRATKKFLNKYSKQFKIIFDVNTFSNGHFTYWNGLTIFLKK